MIAIACDHTGIVLKNQIKQLLEKKGLAYKDFGTDSEQSTDYPKWGYKAAVAVAKGECQRGILICGTGIGIGLAANKVKGIRCANCSDPYSAMMASQHNNCNMISLGARVIGSDLAQMVVETFLDTPFEGGRHQRRVDMIMEIENGSVLE
ncbi:MAG: ribose 5-phosphate isomerase B [Clostridiales bacterium]|nr:ribose 5-phosphate isomerase B [Clostridiales bacterium]